MATLPKILQSAVQNVQQASAAVKNYSSGKETTAQEVSKLYNAAPQPEAPGAAAVSAPVQPVVTPEVSNAYSGAVNTLVNASSGKPVYQNTYGDRLEELYQQIVTRPKFAYDVNADPLYQSLKDQYVQMGKVAMRDTVAQGAALTGGYDNTYAQQVGQQTYDAYLQNLTDAIPELYGQARDTYMMEGDQLNQQYALLGDRADDEYNKYRDALGDYNYQVEWDYQQEQDRLNREFQQEQWQYQQEQDAWDREFKERQYQDALAQQMWERQFAYDQLAAQQAARSYSGGGGGGYSSSSYSGGSSDDYYGYNDVATYAVAAASNGYSKADISSSIQTALDSSNYKGKKADADILAQAAIDAARFAGHYGNTTGIR